MNLYRNIKFLLILLMFSGIAQNLCGQKGRATIVYSGEQHNYSKTYLGKLKQGDLQRLRDYLKQNELNSLETSPNNEVSEDYYKKLMKKERRKENRNQKKYLTDQYNVNEKRLLKRKKSSLFRYKKAKKKLAEKGLRKKQRNSKEKNKGNLFSGVTQKTVKKPPPYLSRYYRISGNRLRKNEKMRYPSGPVSLLIKYKIKTGSSVKTYIDIVDHYLVAGSVYELKYHGSSSKRQYYLEIVL